MGCGISGEGEHARAVSPSVPPFLPSLLASLPPSAASTSTSISTSSCARARARARTHTHTHTGDGQGAGAVLLALGDQVSFAPL